MNKIFITTAIPYVNAKPHIGFGLEVIQADALARYYRDLQKKDVYFLTGSDENSLKNVRAAEKAGEEVADFVNRHAAEFEKLKDVLDLSIDGFIRTSTEKHIKGAQKIWSACNPEDIYKKHYKGWYCVGCEAFYTEKEVPDKKCPEHKKELELIEEDNYFFKLSKYQNKLRDIIANDVIKIIPESRKNEILAFIDSGLEDFSISRTKERAQNWGVPVPGDPEQVMYVWFDALGNYITALDYANNGELYSKFWNNENSERIHMIGKGILRFHAVYWPAMLLSAGLKLPNQIFVHDYLTIEGEKMSKSLGNVISPTELVDEFGTDAVRYYFLREMPESGDGDYSRERMEARYSELANKLGNLVSRVAAMSNKYFDGVLPKVDRSWEKTDKELANLMKNYRFKKYTDTVFSLIDRANEKIDKEEPFKTIKTDKGKAQETLAETAEIIRRVAQYLKPVMPNAANEISERFNGEKILKGDPLFPRRN
ncbi:methionine--tRNA ligase [Candidatus Parcubacteria bacterium]|nr:MAG: methionine--tRNA ligase [Candidatus Parcubacteria bacterium]